MKRTELMKLLDAELLCGGELPEIEINCACGSDMMSDVLAYTKHDAILLTGLCNNHVLRTAEMMDIANIMFVRGKVPTQEIIDMANEMGIVLMTTKLPMFSACGILYQNGITGGLRED
ncbi:MAG: DRTGG domain-containing protein [Christensenellaceae bacterium]|jgi:energy-converting hydrogenase Eha subunit H